MNRWFAPVSAPVSAQAGQRAMILPDWKRGFSRCGRSRLIRCPFPESRGLPEHAQSHLSCAWMAGLRRTGQVGSSWRFQRRTGDRTARPRHTPGGGAWLALSGAGGHWGETRPETAGTGDVSRLHLPLAALSGECGKGLGALKPYYTTDGDPCGKDAGSVPGVYGLGRGAYFPGELRGSQELNGERWCGLWP